MDIADNVLLVGYPNPTIGILSSDGFGNSERAQVNIRNPAGAKVYQETLAVAEGKIQVNMDGFGTGVYFVATTTGKGTRTLKVLKQ